MPAHMPSPIAIHTVLFVLLALLSTLGCKRDTNPPRDRPDPPTLHVPQLNGSAPEIDGRLDDGSWQNAARTEPFVSPGDGSYNAGSPVNAEARVLWTNEALYLAFIVDDAAATSPFERADNDPHVWSAASGIELMLRPADDEANTNYYEVQVGANEEVWDTFFDDYNRPIRGSGDRRRYGHQDWSAQLARAVQIEEERYIVELRLPFAALNRHGADVAAPSPGERWQVNLYAFREGQRHSTAWSALRGEGNFHFAPRFGTFVFEE